MTRLFKTALFIFRRDLRLHDNTGLIFALEKAHRVVPCFIFTPEQIEHNPYRSDRCLQFMLESLEDLEQQLKARGGSLFLFLGKNEAIVEQCIDQLKIEAVVVNRDYTPYSVKRDRNIEAVCKKKGIVFQAFEDALLHPPEDTLKSNGTPYTLFTPFYRNASKLSVPKCKPNNYVNYYSTPLANSLSLYHTILPNRCVTQAKGGRTAGLSLIRNLGKLPPYSKVRDFPFKKGTTHLSPHLKFTTCSPREIYYAMKPNPNSSAAWIRSLYWRDFFTSIAFYFPQVFREAFRTKFNNIAWKNQKASFKRWCEGTTGFPIVDAGMRELKATGYMHNRVRMITASFLTKDLHINWKWGEKYFAQNLIDYDPAINNGNWQWAASTGCDAQPYFRIFNPWTQQKKFDPDCLYIKQWVPELATTPSQKIHLWELAQDRSILYPAPIVDHSIEVKIAKAKYREAAQ